MERIEEKRKNFLTYTSIGLLVVSVLLYILLGTVFLKKKYLFNYPNNIVNLADKVNSFSDIKLTEIEDLSPDVVENVKIAELSIFQGNELSDRKLFWEIIYNKVADWPFFIYITATTLAIAATFINFIIGIAGIIISIIFTFIFKAKLLTILVKNIAALEYILYGVSVDENLLKLINKYFFAIKDIVSAVSSKFLIGIIISAVLAAVYYFLNEKNINEFKRQALMKIASMRAEFDKLNSQVEQFKDVNKKIFSMSQRFVQLQAIGKIIAKSLDPDEIVKAMVNALPQLFGAKKAMLYLIENNRLVLKAEKGLNSEEYAKYQVLPLDPKTNILAFLAIEKLKLAPQELSENLEMKNLLHSSEIKPLLAAPLVHGKKELGVIAILETTDKKDDATLKEDIRILDVLATLGSMALENANLFKKTELLANVDGLTGLYTHRYMQEFLDKELERAKRYKRPVSVILTDIDHFKKFNDVYGHQIGDMVLAETAKILRNTVRKSDLPARYGGEEFMAILPETDYKGAFAFAERLRKNVESASYTDPNTGKILSVTISIGVATFPLHAVEKMELIKQADEALYRAKEGGRNRTCLATVSPEKLKEFEQWVEEGKKENPNPQQ